MDRWSEDHLERITLAQESLAESLAAIAEVSPPRRIVMGPSQSQDEFPHELTAQYLEEERADLVLRSLPELGEEEGRELERVRDVPGTLIPGLVDLVERAIGFGHELSYVQSEESER